MWVKVILSLLFVCGNYSEKWANAFVGNCFSGGPKMQRGKCSAPPGPLSLLGSNSPAISDGVGSSHCCYATKSTARMDSEEESPFHSERDKEYLWYWIDEKCDNNFEVTFRDEDETKGDEEPEESKSKVASTVHFKIYGNPRPLQRHRTTRWRTYNPSAEYQEHFQDAFKKLVRNFYGKSIDDPLFGATEYLSTTIVFRMKRPKSHFVNNKPGPGRLKAKSPPLLASIRSDVDNLTKFVLDSLNGVLYEDDRQIVSLRATKLLDNEDDCVGSIEFFVRSVDEKDVEKLVESSFPL